MGLGFFLTCHAAPFYLKVLDEENDGNYTAWFSQSGLYQNVPEKDFPSQYFKCWQSTEFVVWHTRIQLFHRLL